MKFFGVGPGRQVGKQHRLTYCSNKQRDRYGQHHGPWAALSK